MTLTCPRKITYTPLTIPRTATVARGGGIGQSPGVASALGAPPEEHRTFMPIQPATRIVATVALALALALVAAGCGGRGAAAGITAEPTPVPTAAATATLGPTSAPPTATPEPTPTASPLPTPDLSAVERLLDDTDQDLQADASAGADEGTTP